MSLDDTFLEMIAQNAAKQMLQEYIPQAKAFGLTIDQIKKVIRRTVEIAVKNLS